ncbi:MAG: SH3 domain-containing protein [Chloroflexota bacterium]
MKWNSVFLIIIISAIGLTPIQTRAQADHTNLVGYIASDAAINVRNHPNGAVISSLQPNQSVTVLDKSADGAWVSVDLGDGKSGWVSASFLRVMESAIPADLVPITPDNADQLENITQLASILSTRFEISPDGRLLASISWEGGVKIYDIRTKIFVTELTKHTDALSDVAFSPDGSELASASWDGSVKIWNTQTWGQRTAFLGHTDAVNAVAFSPDGKLVASVGSDGLLNIWDAATGERTQQIDVHSQWMKELTFSPDGTRIAAAGDWRNSSLRLWDVATGESIWLKYSGGNLHFAFTPDGGTIVVASGNTPSITGVNAETSQQTYAISGSSGDSASIALNPAGTVVAVGTWKGIFMVAGVEDKKVLFRDDSLKDSLDASVVLKFSPDGRFLVTSDSDHRINIWGVHGSAESSGG